MAPTTVLVTVALAIAVSTDGGKVAREVLPAYIRITILMVLILAPVALTELVTRNLVDGRAGRAQVLAKLADRFRTATAALATIAPVVLLSLLSAAAGIMKMLLPSVRPFSWDATFARADEILFFGSQPWKLTHAFLGDLGPTLIIDRIYTFWVYLLPIAIAAVTLFAPKFERARFFLSYALVIVLLGIIGAYAFSSAGPCYAPMLSHSLATQFEPLMGRLHAISANKILWAVEWQDLLWKAHRNQWYGVGMGISAMPSIHVALAVLYACLLGQFGLFFAWIGRAFVTVILVGSVHLGWHYAVDGLASAAATLLIWHSVTKYLQLTYYVATLKGERSREPKAQVEQPTAKWKAAR